MTSWFNTPERVAALESAAVSWVGTPFAANSSAKGRGVSCHKLAGALYEEAGFGVVEVPDVPIAHARFSTTSFVLAFFAGRQDFYEVRDILPGDVLGFRIGKCVHHLGVALTGGRFAHAIDGIGATIASIDDATWLNRLERIWRPKP